VANFVYKKAKQAILNGQFNFSADSFRVSFIKSSYIPNENSHEFLSDVPALSIAYTSENITGITNNLGIIDAEDFTSTISADVAFNAIIFYKVGSHDGNSRLLFYIDSSTGLPFTGSSEAVTVVFNWNNDINKILSI
jgi:hypothetical protein